MLRNLTAAMMTAAFAALLSTAAAAEPCMNITTTGSMGGPPVFEGLAGPGTLITYGAEADSCSQVVMQFDAGRGTGLRLSEIGMPVARLNAVFLSHMHSDHTEGLADILQLRWHFNSEGPRVDLVCSSDSVAILGYTLSCAKFAKHIGDPFVRSGEIAQRRAENPARLAGGPSDLINLMTFESGETPQVVWQSGDVTVRAIGSTHVAGHASYRVDTPAGSVVIGGDAGNDTVSPPRATSTSAQVELLAQGADVIVHSTIHPVMGPDGGTGFPPPIFWRQSTAEDLGAMAVRAGAQHLVLTHLIPPLGAPRQGPYVLPGGPVGEKDYEGAARDGGFEGNVLVATDRASLRLPAK